MIELLNVDCMEYMATLPDKAFDLAIVDPPYGININMNMGVRAGEKRKHDSKKWDKKSPDETYFKELRRVSKNQIIWGANNFTKSINPSSEWIYWDKLITGDVEFSAGELAYTSFQGSLKSVKISIQTNYLTEKRIHPTQKPVKLYRWLLKHYAKEGEKILDTHLGSGSSALAAHDMKFDFVGCEIDKEYYEGACKRYKDISMQQKLF